MLINCPVIEIVKEFNSIYFTRLSCDCSSISRPCKVRRRSVISVLDVWRDSVLVATSLFSSVVCRSRKNGGENHGCNMEGNPSMLQKHFVSQRTSQPTLTFFWNQSSRSLWFFLARFSYSSRTSTIMALRSTVGAALTFTSICPDIWLLSAAISCLTGDSNQKPFFKWP